MYKNGERMMAWIAKINEVQPIPDADAICVYRVGGWWVVDKKEAYTVGDLCVYVSIDSWVPHELAPFLSKGHEPREYNGIKGERLRTVKLRGQVSQGLLLPLSVFPHSLGFYYTTDKTVGEDVSHWLGIQKWEAPVPAQLAGDVEGPFPTAIPKTDQERVQNLSDKFDQWSSDLNMRWEVTEKIDGSSMTVYHKDGKFGVCSRNWELKETEANTLWAQARRYRLEEILSAEGNYAIQGELIGEGIQGNPYKIKGHDFYVYDIYDINAGRYLCPAERRAFAERCGLKHVPIVDIGRTLNGKSISDVLQDAEGKSALNPGAEREGHVYKHGGTVSFKSISNRFLIKHGG